MAKIKPVFKAVYFKYNKSEIESGKLFVIFTIFYLISK